MKAKRPAYSVGILAGGKSTRMGQNKALLEFQNETMIGRISRAFSGAGEVLVSAAQRGLYEAEGIRVVYDEHRDIGPMEGIRQLVQSAEEEYVFICAADMPFVNREIADYLAEFISSDYDCYVIEDEEHVHPLCAIYSKRVLPVIEELIRDGRFRLMEILNRVRTKYISLTHTDFDRRILKNINTKEEYRRLVLPVVFAVSGYKHTGKTWLIEKLINEFITAGYSVGVLKHDGHDMISEAEGTDTCRHRAAGACLTTVFSDSLFVMMGQVPEAAEKCPEGPDCTGMGRTGSEKPDCTGTGKNGSEKTEKMAERLIEEMKRQPSPPDIIILEGFKFSKYPKVEIVRKSAMPKSVADEKTLICIAADMSLPEISFCPVLDLDDVAGIFSCIRDYFQI